MPTIYLKATGEALECHSIDAREILEASPDLYSSTPPPAEPDFNGADPREFDHDHDGGAGGSLTKAEIMADLDALEIPYDKRLSRDKLDALLRKDKAAREAAINERAEAEGAAGEE